MHFSFIFPTCFVAEKQISPTLACRSDEFSLCCAEEGTETSTIKREGSSAPRTAEGIAAAARDWPYRQTIIIIVC
jgi:hypothetical protein